MAEKRPEPGTIAALPEDQGPGPSLLPMLVLGLALTVSGMAAILTFL